MIREELDNRVYICAQELSLIHNLPSHLQNSDIHSLYFAANCDCAVWKRLWPGIADHLPGSTVQLCQMPFENTVYYCTFCCVLGFDRAPMGWLYSVFSVFNNRSYLLL